MTANREQILKAAADLTMNYRDTEYGTPHANAKMIAAMWSAYLGFDIKPHDVWNMQAILKITRTKKSPKKLDHYLDGSAYIAMAGEVVGAAEKDPMQSILDRMERLPECDKDRIREVLG